MEAVGKRSPKAIYLWVVKKKNKEKIQVLCDITTVINAIIISLYLMQFPEALRPSFPRLKDKLEDAEPGEEEISIKCSTTIYQPLS